MKREAKLAEAWLQCLSQDTIDLAEMKRLMDAGFDVPNYSMVFPKLRGKKFLCRSIECLAKSSPTHPYKANPYPVILAWMDYYQDRPDWFGGERGVADAGYHVLHIRTEHAEGRTEVLERLVSDSRWIAIHGGFQAGLDVALEYTVSSGNYAEYLKPTIDFLLEKGANLYALDPDSDIESQTFIEMIVAKPSFASYLNQASVMGALQKYLTFPRCGQKSMRDLMMRGIGFHFISHAPHLFELTEEESACAMLAGYQVMDIQGREPYKPKIEALFAKHGNSIAHWSLGSSPILLCAIIGSAPVELVQSIVDAGADPFKAYEEGSVWEKFPLLFEHHTAVDDDEVGPTPEVAAVIIEAMVKRMKNVDDFGPYIFEIYEKEISKAWFDYQAKSQKESLEKGLPKAQKSGTSKGRINPL